MRRLSGVLFLASFGLVSCGDDGNTTSSATGQMTMSTTLPPLTTSTDPSTDSAPTSTSAPTEGSASATDSTTVEPTTTTTGTTEPAVTTAGPTTDPNTSTTLVTTDTTTDTPCQEISVTVQPVKPNTMLVLDKSGSMLSKWDDDADPNTAEVTRWYSLYAVVNQVLTDFNDKFNFGMNLFPSKAATGVYDKPACLVNADVEVPVAEFNKNAILSALPAQNNMTIAGGTPTAIGMTAALTHLKSLDPGVPRIVMLVTDGAANCSTNAGDNLIQLFEAYDDNLGMIVGDAFTMDDIPTYVIGIAIANAPNSNVQDGNPNGINPYEKLNELAELGGTAKQGNEKFYSANNAIELADALNAIANAAQSCVIPLSEPPFFPEETIVKLGDTEVPKIADCANESGWKYVEPEPYMAIELCGTACDDLKLAGEADVEYYCEAG